MYLKYASAALAAVLPLCSAQTYSKCNPLEKTCPPNKGLSSSSFTSDFTTGGGSLSGWTTTSGKVTTGANGAEFTVNKKGDAPTIDTDFYFLFGRAEVVMKAAPGTGIVSSIVLESDVLDEVDWEALGGDNTQIQTNYFGKGDTSSYDRATYQPVATPHDVFHTYAVDWTKDRIEWLIDGAVVRTLAYADAKGGSRFPQTPMRLRLGIWAGGDPDNAQGTIEWAGGQTDYSAAPFSMYIKSVHIENRTPAESYSYSDNSGSYQSIKTSGGGVFASAPSESSTSTTEAPSSSSSSSSSSSTEATTESSTEASTTDAATSTSESSSTPTGMTTSASAAQTDSSSTGGAASATGGSGATGSTTTGSSPSGSEGAPSPSSSLFDGAASSLSSSSMGLVTVFGFIAAMLQL